MGIEGFNATNVIDADKHQKVVVMLEDYPEALDAFKAFIKENKPERAIVSKGEIGNGLILSPTSLAPSLSQRFCSIPYHSFPMGDLSLSQFVLNLADQNFDIYNVQRSQIDSNF